MSANRCRQPIFTPANTSSVNGDIHQPADRRSFLISSLVAGALTLNRPAISQAQTAGTSNSSAVASARDRLKGPMASIVPPFQEDYAIDHGSLGAWAEFMCHSKVPILFQTYGDGELYHLSAAESESIVRTVAGRAKGKSLVVGGTTHGWTNHLIEMAKRLEDAGADAVNLHLYHQDEEEIYRAISQVAEKTSLPLLAYESKWSLGLVQRIAKLPQVIGMKCHAELYQYYAFIRATQEQNFGVLSAGQMKHFLFGFLIGSPAYLCPLTPFAPEYGLKFYDAMVRGDVPAARQVIFDHEEPLLKASIPLGYPNAYKCALYLTGHYQSFAMRPPKKTNAISELAPLRDFLARRNLLKK